MTQRKNDKAEGVPDVISQPLIKRARSCVSKGTEPFHSSLDAFANVLVSFEIDE